MTISDATQQEFDRVRALLDLIAPPPNESLHATDPMWFACVECKSPIWVPECYVVKPARCPDCGGEWSRPAKFSPVPKQV